MPNISIGILSEYIPICNLHIGYTRYIGQIRHEYIIYQSSEYSMIVLSNGRCIIMNGRGG